MFRVAVVTVGAVCACVAASPVPYEKQVAGDKGRPQDAEGTPDIHFPRAVSTF